MFNLPNLLTLSNLFFGSCAIVCLLQGHYVAAICFLFTSGMADFADGLVARAMNISSPIGKELDSLADMVSFGVAPGMMFFQLLSQNYQDPTVGGINMFAALGFVLPCFACLRLAKFNLDTRQSDSFIGLNTPAMTVFASGVILIYHFDSFGLADFVTHPATLFSMIGILSFLMVSEIPMFSFKMKTKGWKGNELPLSFMILGVLQIAILQEVGFCTSVITYLVFSMIENMRGEKSVT